MEEKQALTSRKRKRIDFPQEVANVNFYGSALGEISNEEEEEEDRQPLASVRITKQLPCWRFKYFKPECRRHTSDNGVHTEKPLKEIPAKEDSVQDESTNTLENEETQKKRYILFIGNLPFTVKEDDVKSHFRCTGKESIKEFRLMTKKTGESKGCGFIEFNNKKSYLKALNLHHSVLGGRKINVEVLTCGGGGKGKKREKRLQERKTRFRQGRKRKLRTRKVKSKQKDNSATNKAD